MQGGYEMKFLIVFKMEFWVYEPKILQKDSLLVVVLLKLSVQFGFGLAALYQEVILS